MITSTENRDRLNDYLASFAEDAADTLAKVQRRTAASLTEGTLLDYHDLETLAKAQAAARIWAKVQRIRAYWAEHPDKAPERADLVEAIHEARTEALRDLLGYRGGRSTSGMSNELERAQHEAQQEFVRLTVVIYPDDSPLRHMLP